MSRPTQTPGQMAAAALEREIPMPAAAAKASVPIEVRPNKLGLHELIHAETGEVLGKCATPAIAQKTKEFLK